MATTVLVTQLFHPDTQATAQLLSDLASGLAERGGQVEVLAGFPAAGESSSRAGSCENWGGITIRRGGLRVDGRRNLAVRAVAYGTFCAWAAWHLLFRLERRARILVVSNPPFAPGLVWLCSRLRRWRYDVLLHDIYPDGLVALGALHESSWVARLWRAVNRRTFAGAGRVLAVGRAMRRVVTDRYGVPSSRALYVPNWSPVSPAARRSAESTRLWHALPFPNRFVVQYSGNMGLWHDVETIVQAAWLLRDDPAVGFLLIGDGRRKAPAQRLAAELRLGNLHWLPLQPQADLEDTLACCHVAIVSQRAGLEGIAVPCKLYGILASGRAVIAQAPSGSEVAEVVRDAQCGIVVAPGNAAALAEAVRSLARHPAETEAMGRRAFEVGRTQYSRNAAVARFCEAWAKGAGT